MKDYKNLKAEPEITTKKMLKEMASAIGGIACIVCIIAMLICIGAMYGM